MSSELGPVYLIYGTDRSKVRQALGRLRAHFADDAIENADASTESAADIVARCSMMSLVAERRLIVVQGADGWKAADVDEMLSYIKDPSQDCVLALIADKVASNSRLLKACSKAPAQALKYEGPDAKSIDKWIAAAFEQQGATVDARVVRTFVSIVGRDAPTDRYATDIAKIVTYAGSEKVTPAMVEMLATPDLGESVWKLGDAWASLDRNRLVAHARELLDPSHPAKATAPFLALILGRHITVVAAAKRLLATMSPGQATNELKARLDSKLAWKAKDYIAQAERLPSLARADASLARIALLEAELKGATPLSSKKDGASAVFYRGLCELV
jgi:DNA polymerase III delta subunit